MSRAARHERRQTTRSGVGPRTKFERDRDRVLYSDSFQRLKGITQVASAEETYRYHTRLTHSLKVGQVGRRLAQYLLRKYDGRDTNVIKKDNREISIQPVAVETAALCHDLGHPPFGHATEKQLDELIRNSGISDGFEGNPQSFRIVTNVEANALYVDSSTDEGRGLNLTRASLNGMIKYPWERGESIPSVNYDTSEKYGYYQGYEQDVFDWARKKLVKHVRSPEAVLMDWADDVTYAVHDLIDFYRSGIIPLQDILQDTKEQERFIRHFEDKKGDSIPDSFEPSTFIEDLRNQGIDESEMLMSYQGSRQVDSLLRFFQSRLIGEYLNVPEVVDVVPPGEAENGRPATEKGVNRLVIDIDPKKQAEIELLKELTFYYVIENSTLARQQEGHRRATKTIFNSLMGAATDSYSKGRINGEYIDEKIIPPMFREELLEAGTPSDRVRIVADTITSMTERQMSQLYAQLTGFDSGSIQEDIL